MDVQRAAISCGSVTNVPCLLAKCLVEEDSPKFYRKKPIIVDVSLVVVFYQVSYGPFYAVPFGINCTDR